MANIDLTTNRWTDMIFAGRNQAYGAYRLRRDTPKRNVWSIICIAALAILIVGIFWIKTAYDEYQAAHVKVEQVNELTALKEKKKAKVERKAPVIQQKKQEVVKEVKSSIKFVAPVIKKDNEVKPEEQMKTQEELQNTNTAIGALTVEGNSDKGVILQVAQRVADEPVAAPKKEVENKVFDIVENMPEFPGGMAALNKFLSENVRYPVVAQENGVQGRVTIQFVVEKDGSVTDVKVAKGVDPSLDKEALRVVKSMPKWIPGKQNGAPVRVKYMVPVTFRLQQ